MEGQEKDAISLFHRHKREGVAHRKEGNQASCGARGSGDKSGLFRGDSSHLKQAARAIDWKKGTMKKSVRRRRKQGKNKNKTSWQGREQGRNSKERDAKTTKTRAGLHYLGMRP